MRTCQPCDLSLHNSASSLAMTCRPYAQKCHNKSDKVTIEEIREVETGARQERQDERKPARDGAPGDIQNGFLVRQGSGNVVSSSDLPKVTQWLKRDLTPKSSASQERAVGTCLLLPSQVEHHTYPSPTYTNLLPTDAHTSP